jgi:hypothetical protein
LVLVIFESLFWASKGKITKLKNETMNLHTHNAANVGYHVFCVVNLCASFLAYLLEFGFFQD